jgi:GcrA cell cycle regulator
MADIMPSRRNTALALHPFVIEAAAPQTVRDVVVPISEPVTIVELRESMCHWPIGDPAQSEFRFCGAKKLPGQGPYCACHAGIAYQTQHDRRRGGGRKVGLAPSPMIAGPWPVIRFATVRGFSRLAGTEPHTARASNSRNFIVTAARTT